MRPQAQYVVRGLARDFSRVCDFSTFFITETWFSKEILVEFSVFCYRVYRKIQCFRYVELSASDAA